MIEPVVTDIDIAVPPEVVWETIMDPARFNEWVTIHRNVNYADPGPPRKGMRMDQTLTLRGASVKVKWELVEVCDGRRAVWRGKGPMRSRARTVYDLSSDGDGGTRFHYVNEFKVSGGAFGAAASRMLSGGLPERAARQSLQRLKALLEHH